MIMCSSEVKPRSVTHDASLGINMQGHLQLDRCTCRWPNFHSSYSNLCAGLKLIKDEEGRYIFENAVREGTN